MTARRIALVLVALAVVSLGASRADTIFPARLEMNETELGLFEVRFVLPVINDARLRATPVFPAVFTEVGEPHVTRSAVEYSESRILRCDPDSLFGQRIAIRGLVGTQIDVVFTLATLDGRQFSATLKPARAVYEIPTAPTLLGLAGEGIVHGARSIIRNLSIVLVVLTLIALGSGKRVVAGLSFLLCILTGEILALSQLVRLPPQIPVVFSGVLVVLSVGASLKGHPQPLARFSPLWISFGLFGLFIGSAGSGITIGEYFSRHERFLAYAVYAGGLAAGLLLLGLLASQTKVLLRTYVSQNARAKLYRATLTSVGVMGAALVCYQLSGIAFGARLLPEAPAEIYLAAAGTGLWLGTRGTGMSLGDALSILGSGAAGLVLGHTGVPMPFESTIATGSLFFLGFALVLGRFERILVPASALLFFFQGWHAAAFIVDNLSYPLAVTTAMALVSGAILWIVFSLSVPGTTTEATTDRVSGTILMVIAVVLRCVDYVDWVDSSLSGEITLGFVPIPVLSLVLIVLALIAWPRRRRVQRLLGLQSRPRFLHWAFLVVAFFTLTIGVVRARNVFFTPRAPRGEVARTTLEHVLGATYEAFNIADEDELYRRLSESVAGELVAEIYLDSRRKLTSGVRQGAQVMVRGVEVLSLDDRIVGTSPSEGYTYQCTWAVTARVTHLQHLHHRRNVYSGTIRLRLIDDRWKIDRLALQSEERVIIPWSVS